MSLIDDRIRLSIFHIILLATLSTFFGFLLFKPLESTNNPVSLILFEIQFKDFMLIIVFLTSFFLSVIISRFIKFNTYELHAKWERKNPDAVRIYDQTMLELYGDCSTLKRRVFRFLVWNMAAILLFTYSFPILTIFIDHLSEQQKIIMMLASFLVVIPITHMIAIIPLTTTFGHKRIYHQNGVLFSREAFVFRSIGGFNQKLEKFVDMVYNEEHGKEVSKFTLKISGWLGITIASSTNFDKINELRHKIDAKIEDWDRFQ
jgi:hypothetical protein